MSFIDNYKQALETHEILESFVDNNLNELYDYYGLLNHDNLVKNRGEFEQLSLKVPVINQLDFRSANNEAYLNLILNASVRLGNYFVFNQFYNILKNKGLEESKLIKAASLFMFSRSAEDFLNPYDDIISCLEDSYSNETDNSDEPIALLLNYYSLFINHFVEFASGEVLKLIL